MPVAASMGSQSRLSFAAASTAVGSYTEIQEFNSESLAKKQTLLDTMGISGGRSHQATRQRDGTYTVGGNITMNPGPVMLTAGGATAQCILSRALGGGAPTGTTYALGETVPFFDTLIDRIQSRWIYGNCKINKATFKAKASSLLELSLDILGQTETISATAFPALAVSTDIPFVWQDCVIVVNGVTCVATEFELTLDNHLTARFSNSISATDLYPTDRTVSLKLTVPWTSDYSTLYGMNTANAAVPTCVFTNGGHILTFTFGLFEVPDHSPVVKSKGEIFLMLDGIVKQTGATKELAVTCTAA